MRFLLRILVTGLALWATTWFVPGITVTPFADGLPAAMLTFGFVALVFGVINGTVGVVLKIVSIPLYILTLGLFSFVLNGLLLMLAGWASQLFGFGLAVQSFGWGVLGAFVLGMFSWLIGLVIRPGKR